MDLKELRISKGYTQLEISNISNIPLRTYKRIEKEDKYISSFKYKELVSLISSLENKSKNNKLNKKNIDISTYKIAVKGAGYVGLPLGVLLSNKYDVTIFDIDNKKIESINKKESYLKDSLLSKYLTSSSIKASHISSLEYVYDIYILSLPTDLDVSSNQLNTSLLDEYIENIYKENLSSLIVIKSTIPLGYMDKIISKYKDINIIYSPEFIKENTSMYDTLYPTRIIIGCNKDKLYSLYSNLISSILLIKPNIYKMNYKEAEASKLFANAYLALRVTFMNEIDSYALENNINSKNIIASLGDDPRIGNYYNNPSFGYGGYCLTKDVKSLSSSLNNLPLIDSIDISNKNRINIILDSILVEAYKRSNNPIIGIYRLNMKKDSDNTRFSISSYLVEELKNKGITLLIYEPSNKDVSNTTLEELKKESALIVANRNSKELNDVLDKVFTRDIFNNN